MPPAHAIVAFAAAAAAIIIVPGPSVLFVVGRGVAYGRRAALATVVGNAAGVYVQVMAVALGVGAIVERSIVVFTAVKLVGAAYLVDLGVRALLSARRGAVATAESTERGPADPVSPHRSHGRDGFVVGVANPKVIVFLAAILPQFVATDGAPAGVQMAVLGLVFVGIALVLDSSWALLAGTARSWFRRSPDHLRRLTGFGGLVREGLGVRVGLSSTD